MEVRHFENADIQEAGEMVYDYWSGELPDSGESIKRVIYEYMVRYYDRNRHLSFSITDNGRLKGFLLAFRKDDSTNSMDWLSSELIKFSTPEQELALEYHLYYQRNGAKMKEQMETNCYSWLDCQYSQGLRQEATCRIALYLYTEGYPIFISMD